MASQLENTYDLYQDTKQAQNVCFELHKPFGMNQEALNKCVDMKDATTQTISSKFTFGLRAFFLFKFFFKVSREEKSLGIMSQKFLMLFLTSEVNFYFFLSIFVFLSNLWIFFCLNETIHYKLAKIFFYLEKKRN